MEDVRAVPILNTASSGRSCTSSLTFLILLRFAFFPFPCSGAQALFLSSLSSKMKSEEEKLKKKKRREEKRREKRGERAAIVGEKGRET